MVMEARKIKKELLKVPDSRKEFESLAGQYNINWHGF
jgi:lysozyme family protein